MRALYDLDAAIINFYHDLHGNSPFAPFHSFPLHRPSALMAVLYFHSRFLVCEPLATITAMEQLAKPVSSVSWI